MKKYLIIIIGIIIISSCKKEEPIVQEKNSIVEDLKGIMEQEGIQALDVCFVNGTCSSGNGTGKDYEFIGDNFVFVNNYFTYNLNNLVYYRIENYGTSANPEKHILLYLRLP